MKLNKLQANKDGLPSAPDSTVHAILASLESKLDDIDFIIDSGNELQKLMSGGFSKAKTSSLKVSFKKLVNDFGTLIK